MLTNWHKAACISNSVAKLMFLILTLILLSAQSPDLAYIIEGEASTCQIDGKVAVAWVYSRNSTFYGWADPSDDSIMVSNNWFQYPDPTFGANHLFSAEDIKTDRVKAIIGDQSPLSRFPCGALTLLAYRIDP